MIQHNHNNPPIAVIHARNADTSGSEGMVMLFGLIPATFVVIDVIFNITSIPFFLTFLITMIINSLYVLYYWHYPKNILIYKDQIVGPFFQFTDMIRFPFKVNFTFNYDDIDKIEFCFRSDYGRFYVKTHMKNETTRVGLKDGEEVRLREIIKKIRPDIAIENNCESFTLSL